TGLLPSTGRPIHGPARPGRFAPGPVNSPGGDQAGVIQVAWPHPAPWAPRRAGRRVWPGRACAVPGETVMTAHMDVGARRWVVSSDVHADSRWPELRTRLSAQVRAVAGTLILLGGSPVGTLNVYRGEPVEWDKSDVNALIAYSGLIAEVLAVALAAQEHGIVADQLQSALDY